jgi:D-alanyl-D-alanine dipeptidase
LRIWKCPIKGVAPRQQRNRLREKGGTLDVGLPRRCTDANRAVPTLDAAQLLDLTDIDEMVERSEAQGQHRHQALPARQNLCCIAELCQQRHGFRCRLRPVIVEG